VTKKLIGRAAFYHEALPQRGETFVARNDGVALGTVSKDQNELTRQCSNVMATPFAPSASDDATAMPALRAFNCSKTA
jgi:hypothetical protein